MNKSAIRKKILRIRKSKDTKKYKINYLSLLKIIRREKIKGKFLGGYYPYNYELDTLSVMRKLEAKKFNILLPKIKTNSQMNFFKWSTSDPLITNIFGIPEPISKKIMYPDIILVPLVAFDNNLNRIGYGGGFYDRYISKIKKNKNVLTIGLAFSFQKVKRIPINKHDIKLDYILTEKD